MERQDQRARRADAQPLPGRDALVFKHLDLFQQGAGRQHDAITHQTAHAIAQYARGDQVQDCLFSIDYQGMPGIVAALEPYHGGHSFGQQINDLALAFVTPLGTDDDYISAHVHPSSSLVSL